MNPQQHTHQHLLSSRLVQYLARQGLLCLVVAGSLACTSNKPLVNQYETKVVLRVHLTQNRGVKLNGAAFNGSLELLAQQVEEFIIKI